VALSAFGSLNGSVMTSARIFYAAGVDGLIPFPNLFKKISRDFNTPYVAIFVLGSVACLVTIPGRFSALVSYFGYATWIFYSLCAVSLIWIRYKKPEIVQKFKVRPFPILPMVFIGCGASICLSTLIQSPLPTILASLFLLTAVPLYILFFWRGNMLLKAYRRLRKKMNTAQTTPELEMDTIKQEL
jgi:basic amino acid/polyamine antiporter, APA family